MSGGGAGAMGRWLRAPILALCLMPAGVAAAQDWATPETCRMAPLADPADALPAADRAVIEKAAAAIPFGTGRLWRITAPGGQVSHLWGTHHSSDPLILDLPPELKALLPGAAVLVLENDPVAASRVQLEERALQAGMWLAPADADYPKDWLSGPLRDWIAARLKAITFQDGTLPRLTDAGLAELMLGDPCEDFAAGVLPVQDNRLYLAAHEAGVPVAGLEKESAFLSEMSQPDRRDVAQAIAKVYGAYLDPDGFSQGRSAVAALYRQGRIGALMASNRAFLDRIFGADEAGRLAALADGYLLDERNRTFLARMRKHLDHGQALIAVGAFHLPGSQGLLADLQAAGYRVERVPTSGEAE